MMLTSDQKPDVMYADIGGMDIQKQEVREAVELPLTHFELYKQIGIDPPEASSCTAHLAAGRPCWQRRWHTTRQLRSSASWAPSLCRSTWARAPHGPRRVPPGQGERARHHLHRRDRRHRHQEIRCPDRGGQEVQRILLELLNQMDGFDQNVNVKVIMATNRADTLTLLCCGRDA